MQDDAFKSDSVVMSNGSFLFERKNQIKIHVRLERNKGRALLLGFDGEALIKSVGINFPEETIGSIF